MIVSRSLTLCLTTFVFYCSLYYYSLQTTMTLLLRYHSVKLPLSLHGRQNIHQMPRTRRVMPGLNWKSSSYCHDVTHTLALVHMTIVTGVLRCRRVLTFPLFCEFLYRPGCTPVQLPQLHSPARQQTLLYAATSLAGLRLLPLAQKKF